jgi:hypothetical protein
MLPFDIAILHILRYSTYGQTLHSPLKSERRGSYSQRRIVLVQLHHVFLEEFSVHNGNGFE